MTGMTSSLIFECWHQESRVKSQCRDDAVMGGEWCSVGLHMVVWDRCSAVLGGAGRTMRSHSMWCSVHDSCHGVQESRVKSQEAEIHSYLH